MKVLLVILLLATAGGCVLATEGDIEVYGVQILQQQDRTIVEVAFVNNATSKVGEIKYRFHNLLDTRVISNLGHEYTALGYEGTVDQHIYPGKTATAILTFPSMPDVNTLKLEFDRVGMLGGPTGNIYREYTFVVSVE